MKRHVWIYDTGKPACGTSIRGMITLPVGTSYSDIHSPLVFRDGVPATVMCLKCFDMFFDRHTLVSYTVLSQYIKPLYKDDITVLPP